MSQSSVILNVQHQLEDILSNQNVIVQNQSEMIEKLNIIDSRLLNVEKYLIIQQQRLNQSPKTLSPHSMVKSTSLFSTSAAINNKSAGAAGLINKSKHSSLFGSNSATSTRTLTSVTASTNKPHSSSTSSLTSNDENNHNIHNNHNNINNNHNHNNNHNDTNSSSSITTLNHLIHNKLTNSNYPFNHYSFNNNNHFNNGNSKYYFNKANKHLLQHTRSHLAAGLPNAMALRNQLTATRLLAKSKQQQQSRPNELDSQEDIEPGETSTSNTSKEKVNINEDGDNSDRLAGDHEQYNEEDEDHIQQQQQLLHQADIESDTHENEDDAGLADENLQDSIESASAAKKFKSQSKSSNSLNSGLSLTNMIAAAARQQQQLQMQHHKQQQQQLLLEDDEEEDDEDDENYELDYKPMHLQHHMSQHRLFESRQIDDTQLQISGTDETTGQQLITENEIKRIFAVSKSRGNFAALLVQQLYARHERIISNVMGTRGKRQLSPRRMAVVKRLSFNMYPPPNEREEELIWKKECVKAIDSKNRKVRISIGGGGNNNNNNNMLVTPSSSQPSGSATTSPNYSHSYMNSGGGGNLTSSSSTPIMQSQSNTAAANSPSTSMMRSHTTTPPNLQHQTSASSSTITSSSLLQAQQQMSTHSISSSPTKQSHNDYIEKK